MNKIYVPKRILITGSKKDVLIVLPFLGQFSLNLRSRLYNCFNKTLPQCNIQVSFQSKNRLSNLFRFKDSIPKELRSHIVYKFLCSNCNIIYYGETECHLNVRSGEHLSLSALTSERVNNNKKSAFKPAVYRRYVDDIFVLFKSKDHLLLFAKYMNTRHKSFKFTFDFEQNNRFSFLDVKITRGSNGFSTSVFRKAMFSGVFTNFDSFIFESYKTGLIFTLVYHCFTICSDIQSFHLEVEQLRQIFKCNN